ncbi:MFS transporter, DHA2 family, lincomycin resistance protein [Cryobacterium levicorallinum]|uniref:MFS transporter, DHA2 family, lincomycin resistance protein n=2 Tax=Cryobacterium TaxID=69578 RepID=A0ABY1E9G9_9MICO|nr:MFS transporter, DHA2 family, lincomycin resistance protein [Cryobacterium levicorallinum]
MTRMGETTEPWMLMVAHIGMSAGLSLLFTPLFTSGLGSLGPSLYSHGSAVVGTVQQLAGAIGTALFIAVMTSQSAALIAQGVNEVSATAAGIRGAFLCGAIISLFAIPAAFLVRRPPLDAPVPIGH